MSEIELPATEFRSICAKLGYRRRKVRVKTTESVILQELNWSGGTRNVYHAMDIQSEQIFSATNLHRLHNESEGARVALSPGRVIIRTGHFLGKEAIMIIYVHPANMPALLTN